MDAFSKLCRRLNDTPHIKSASVAGRLVPAISLPWVEFVQRVCRLGASCSALQLTLLPAADTVSSTMVPQPQRRAEHLTQTIFS